MNRISAIEEQLSPNILSIYSIHIQMQQILSWKKFAHRDPEDKAVGKSHVTIP